MFLKNYSVDAGLEFKLWSVQLRTVMYIEGSLVMSHKCYDVALEFRALVAAAGKSKDAAARELKLDVQRIQVWCSKKRRN